MNSTLICYTRHPLADEIYASRLAYSMHLGFLNADGSILPLNHDYGILFPKAERTENGCLKPRSLSKPWMFKMKDGYGIIALACSTEGCLDDGLRGNVLFFTTKDLVHYVEHDMLRVCPGAFVRDMRCSYQAETDTLFFVWKNMDGSVCSTNLTDPLGRPQCGEIGSIEDYPPEMAQDITKRTDIEVGNTVVLTGKEEAYLKNKLLPGKMEPVHTFSFPVAEWRADPCVTWWEGNYYFIATNDADGNNSLSIRCARHMEDLPDAEEKLILDSHMYPHLKGLLWAPEFHVIGGEMYLYHGGTAAGFEREQCLVTKLRHGGDMCKAGDWETPRRIVKADDRPLYGEEGITLDLTCFEASGQMYAVWSQRQFHPVDVGAFLYIARLDAEHPWKLESEPVLLTTPEYGWENNHTFVVEGAYALVRPEKVCLTYAAAAIDTTYTVGLLTADVKADLTDPSVWRKNNYPLQTSFSHEGEFGPGHNSFVTDENGIIWNCYHAHPGLHGPRCSGIRQIMMDADDEPKLD